MTNELFLEEEEKVTGIRRWTTIKRTLQYTKSSWWVHEYLPYVSTVVPCPSFFYILQCLEKCFQTLKRNP